MRNVANVSHILFDVAVQCQFRKIRLQYNPLDKTINNIHMQKPNAVFQAMQTMRKI